MTSVYWVLRRLDAPRDRPGRKHLADVIARTIAADRRFCHQAAADEQITSARNMLIHRWVITGVSTEIARGFGDELAAWIRLYKNHRALIHSGRMVRIDTPDDTAWMYGVVAADASAAA